MPDDPTIPRGDAVPPTPGGTAPTGALPVESSPGTKRFLELRDIPAKAERF